MKLCFVVNDDYLVYYILSSPEHGNALITELQNTAWEFSATLYDFVIGRNRPNTFTDSHILKDLPAFFERIKHTDQFQQILTETKEHKKDVETKWESNFEHTQNHIKNITGWKESELDKTFTVYITHPALPNGRYCGDNIIEWGPRGSWSHYETVYLWHEILHSYFEFTLLEHVLIELIANNELRVKLNGGTYPPFEAHEETKQPMHEILSHWHGYLEQKERNIWTFCEDMKGLFPQYVKEY